MNFVTHSVEEKCRWIFPVLLKTFLARPGFLRTRPKLPSLTLAWSLNPVYSCTTSNSVLMNEWTTRLELSLCVSELLYCSSKTTQNIMIPIESFFIAKPAWSSFWSAANLWVASKRLVEIASLFLPSPNPKSLKKWFTFIMIKMLSVIFRNIF